MELLRAFYTLLGHGQRHCLRRDATAEELEDVGFVFQAREGLLLISTRSRVGYCVEVRERAFEGYEQNVYPAAY